MHTKKDLLFVRVKTIIGQIISYLCKELYGE